MVDSGKYAIYAALLTAAAGVLTTLLTLLFGWLLQKGVASRRIRAVDEAFKRVQFLDAWYKTRTVAAPSELEEARGTVLRELDFAMQSVKDSDAPATSTRLRLKIERDEAVAQLPRSRRWLLLYKPARRLSWLPRFFFYISMLAAAAATVGLSITVILMTRGEHDLDEAGLMFAAIGGGYFAIGICARWFAIFVDTIKVFRA